MDTQTLVAGAVEAASALPAASINGVHDGRLAWCHSDEASNDFRSDIFTKPTLAMLEAIAGTTLGDSEFDEDATTHAFQDYVAGLVGHEVALLVVSGTMGNHMALRTALSFSMAPPWRPTPILADHRGHIVNWESGSVAMTSAAQLRTVVPANGHHLTLADVERVAVTSQTVYDFPTRINLENPLWGSVLPLADMRAIAACFDSMQMCLSKGLGAPIGSVITGRAAFIARAKWNRHLLGGGIRAGGLIAAPARVAIDHVFLAGKLQAAQAKARRASALWEQLGGKLQKPTETNMVRLDIEGSGLVPSHFYATAQAFDLKIMELVKGRLAFHYQISDAAFARICDFFAAVLKKRCHSVAEVNGTLSGTSERLDGGDFARQGAA